MHQAHFLRRNILIAFALCSLVITAQVWAKQPTVKSLAGPWISKAQGSKLTLHNRGSFLMQGKGWSTQGRWRLSGSYLWLKNAQGQTLSYKIRSLTRTTLSLADARGIKTTFRRHKISRTSIPTRRASTKVSEALKEGMDVRYELISFITGAKLTKGEKRALLSEARQSRKATPKAFDSETRSLEGNMEKLGSLKNPIQIAVARDQLRGVFHLMEGKLPKGQIPAMIRILRRRTPVLAHDAKNQLVLEKSDLNAFIAYCEFAHGCFCRLTRNQIPVSNQVKMQLRQSVLQGFNQIPLEKKRFICAASVYWTALCSVWPRLTTNQRSVLDAKYACRFPDPAQARTKAQSSSGGFQARMNKKQRDFNARQNMFNMMQNMNLNQHATMLNTIENYGNTGIEWKVNDGY